MSGQTRIINRLADAQLVSGDYVLVDSQTEGTRKFDLGTFANTTNTAISNIESAINNTSEAIGDTDISDIGDGTFTGGLADHEERLDDISGVIGNTSIGTTATTLTGAIAEHEGDITSLNNNFPFVAKYITRTVTLPQGSAASPSVTELDLTSEAPAGKSLYFAIVAVGVYCLPYIGPSAATYTTAYRISTNKLAIYNGGAAWNASQTVYILGFFR